MDVLEVIRTRLPYTLRLGGVGFVLHRNTDPVNTPCHRVVFKDGSLCKGYVFGGPDVQRKKLEAEGVQFLPDGRVDMKACGWFGENEE